jgi:hypothetical protein
MLLAYGVDPDIARRFEAAVRKSYPRNTVIFRPATDMAAYVSSFFAGRTRRVSPHKPWASHPLEVMAMHPILSAERRAGVLPTPYELVWDALVLPQLAAHDGSEDETQFAFENGKFPLEEYADRRTQAVKRWVAKIVGITKPCSAVLRSLLEDDAARRALNGIIFASGDGAIARSHEALTHNRRTNGDKRPYWIIAQELYTFPTNTSGDERARNFFELHFSDAVKVKDRPNQQQYMLPLDERCQAVASFSILESLLYRDGGGRRHRSRRDQHAHLIRDAFNHVTPSSLATDATKRAAWRAGWSHRWAAEIGKAFVTHLYRMDALITHSPQNPLERAAWVDNAWATEHYLTSLRRSAMHFALFTGFSHPNAFNRAAKGADSVISVWERATDEARRYRSSDDGRSLQKSGSRSSFNGTLKRLLDIEFSSGAKHPEYALHGSGVMRAIRDAAAIYVYTDEALQTYHSLREAIREADNNPSLSLPSLVPVKHIEGSYGKMMYSP